MSQENVEIVPDDGLDVMRLLFDTWNRAELDAFSDLYDADAELITDPSWMEAGSFRGRAAIRAWHEGIKQAWEGRDAVVLRELFEVGDKVVARLDWQVRGRTSGMEMHLDATSVNTIKRGKIVRQQWYFDHAEALEAVGLRE
jgi:ketosteroid isomerase-like protein